MYVALLYVSSNFMVNRPTDFVCNNIDRLVYAVAVLVTARPGAEKNYGAPTPGKKLGPNIIKSLLNMRLICYRKTK